MLDHVFGFGLNGRFRFQVGLAGTVTQNIHALLEIVITEDILKSGVHRLFVGHFRVMRTPLINNLQRHPIINGLPHGVFVDIVAEDTLCLVDRCACVADAGGVWNTLIKVRPQHGVLRAMRLVGHHQNVRAGI